MMGGLTLGKKEYLHLQRRGREGKISNDVIGNQQNEKRIKYQLHGKLKFVQKRKIVYK